MITTDELREAASRIVGKQRIGRVMREFGTPPVSPQRQLRRRTYSDESPIFVPGF